MIARRRAFGTAAAAAVSLGLLCACDAPALETVAPDARRARVVEFWRLYHEASALRARGDRPGATNAYEAALQLDPDHEDSLYHLGQCLQEGGRAAEALAAYRHLVQVNDQSARGHLALGALLSSSDDGAPWELEQAEHHLRRAHELNGEETGPMVRLGEVRLLRGDRGEAESWLNAAARTNPRSVEAAFVSGFLRWRAGDQEGARSWYARALGASRTEAPVKGVLNEGDRKAPPVPAGADAMQATRVAAPPLASPMGKTLFGDLCARLPALDAETAYAEAGRQVERLSRRSPRTVPG